MSHKFRVLMPCVTTSSEAEKVANLQTHWFSIQLPMGTQFLPPRNVPSILAMLGIGGDNGALGIPVLVPRYAEHTPTFFGLIPAETDVPEAFGSFSHITQLGCITLKGVLMLLIVVQWREQAETEAECFRKGCANKQLSVGSMKYYEPDPTLLESYFKTTA